MKISDILPIILCSSIIGLLVGLFAKVISNNIQKNVLIYTMKVVLRETIIYPLFFPLFFNRKKYAKIKAGEIIYKLKDENINGINIEKLEKYIYDDLTFMKVCNMWKIVIKDMFHNFDENVLDIIYKVKESGLSEIIYKKKVLKAQIKSNNREIKHNNRYIAYLKTILVIDLGVKDIIKKFKHIYLNNNKHVNICKYARVSIKLNITSSYEDKIDMKSNTIYENQAKRYLKNL